VHGHSLGSGVAVAIAAQDDVVALILDAPFTRLDDVAADKFPFLPTSLMFDKFRSDERIRKVKAERIFIVHGTNDVVIPLRFGRELASKRNDAVFMVIEGGGHESILGVSDVTIERAITTLFRQQNPHLLP
jgi:pimeloyl-ACP methyl ester carboxylesterase